jgi:hypothetical protein
VDKGCPEGTVCGITSMGRICTTEMDFMDSQCGY